MSITQISVRYQPSDVLDAFFSGLTPVERSEWDQVLQPVSPAPSTFPSDLAADGLAAPSPSGPGAGTPFNESAWRSIADHLTRQYLALVYGRSSICGGASTSGSFELN